MSENKNTQTHTHGVHHSKKLQPFKICTSIELDGFTAILLQWAGSSRLCTLLLLLHASVTCWISIDFSLLPLTLQSQRIESVYWEKLRDSGWGWWWCLSLRNACINCIPMHISWRCNLLSFSRSHFHFVFFLHPAALIHYLANIECAVRCEQYPKFRMYSTALIFMLKLKFVDRHFFFGSIGWGFGVSYCKLQPVSQSCRYAICADFLLPWYIICSTWSHMDFLIRLFVISLHCLIFLRGFFLSSSLSFLRTLHSLFFAWIIAICVFVYENERPVLCTPGGIFRLKRIIWNLLLVNIMHTHIHTFDTLGKSQDHQFSLFCVILVATGTSIRI